MATETPTKKPRKRYSHKLARERLDVVDQMLRQCWTHSAIQVVLAKKWDISKRQVRNYIKKTYARWDEDAKKTLVDRVHLRRAQLEGILEMAMQQAPPDLRIAVSALDRLCRVDGAYAAEKAEVTVTGNIESEIRHMTSDDQRKAIAELWDKYQLPDIRKANGKENGSLPH